MILALLQIATAIFACFLFLVAVSVCWDVLMWVLNFIGMIK